jgi:hypothetical protein
MNLDAILAKPLNGYDEDMDDDHSSTLGVRYFQTKAIWVVENQAIYGDMIYIYTYIHIVIVIISNHSQSTIITIIIWLVVWNIRMIFPYIGNVMECHVIPTDFQSIICQRGRAKNHQPVLECLGISWTTVPGASVWAV